MKDSGVKRGQMTNCPGLFIPFFSSEWWNMVFRPQGIRRRDGQKQPPTSQHDVPRKVPDSA
jgi:hypothetical protein